MTQEYHRSGNPYSRKRRIQEVAYLYFEGWSEEEIAEESGYSVRTIQRDIEYVEAHKEEFPG